MWVRSSVNVATGDVKEDGVVIPDADKTDHVEVMPQSGSTTRGRRIKFKQIVKGFTKEVKLTRGSTSA